MRRPCGWRNNLYFTQPVQQKKPGYRLAMARPFLHIYLYFAGHRKIFFTVLTGLFLLTGLTTIKIKPEEDISKILPKDRQAEKLNELLKEARFADKLVLMISSKDSGKNSPEIQSAFADSFSSQLQKGYPLLIRSVVNRVSDNLFPRLIDIVTAHLPVFLEPEDYIGIDSLDNPEQVRVLLTQDKNNLSSPAGLILKNRISRDPLG